MKSLSKRWFALEQDPLFLEKIDSWVGQRISNQASSFRELLNVLPGVYPSEVLASLYRLENFGHIAKFLRDSMVTEAQSPVQTFESITKLAANKNSVEHPLDFEWLFTNTAKELILKEARRLKSDPQSPILCLGCPSLYTHGKNTMYASEFCLWDKNHYHVGQLTEAESLTKIDLTRDKIPKIEAEIAILDPPWYNDFYKLFIWAALQSTSCGGKIMFSFPPSGTRPSADDDLKMILQWCKDAGLALVYHKKSCLSYCSPLFEVNSFREQGLYNIPLDWRRGDLVVLKKEISSFVQRPVVQTFANFWADYQIGSVRIKVRKNDLTMGDFPLLPVHTSAILPSVSTRFFGREQSQIVTSGNRFYKTESLGSAMHLCDAFSKDSELLKFKPKSGTFPGGLNRQLVKLLQIEEDEAHCYHNAVNDL